jgi:hypothetical protein
MKGYLLSKGINNEDAVTRNEFLAMKREDEKREKEKRKRGT